MGLIYTVAFLFSCTWQIHLHFPRHTNAWKFTNSYSWQRHLHNLSSVAFLFSCTWQMHLHILRHKFLKDYKWTGISVCIKRLTRMLLQNIMILASYFILMGALSSWITIETSWKGTCAICILLLPVSDSLSSHRYTDLQFNLISQAAVRPPTFVFFVNDAKLFPETYRRYMEKQLRAGAGFAGTPIRLLWRSRRKMGKDESKMLIIFLSITLWVAKSYLLMYLKMIRRFIYVYCP